MPERTPNHPAGKDKVFQDPAEELRRVIFPEFNPANINKVSSQDVIALIDKFRGMWTFAGAKLDSFADTPEGKTALEELIKFTLQNMEEFGKIDVSNEEKVLEMRERVISFLPKYLAFSRDQIALYLIPASAYRKQKTDLGKDVNNSDDMVPLSYQSLAKTYFEILNKYN